MCVETEFVLIKSTIRTVDGDNAYLTRFNFLFQNAEVMDAEVGTDPAIKLLREQLQKASQKWILVFTVTLRKRTGTGRVIVPFVDLEVRGDILDTIHSTLIWGKDRDLNMNIEMDLGAYKATLLDGDEEDGRILFAQFKQKVMLPAGQNSSIRHMIYKAWDLETNFKMMTPEMFDEITQWKISNLVVTVSNQECSCNPPRSSVAYLINKELLEKRSSNNFEIVTKENVIIPSIDYILAVQSPMLRKMIEEECYTVGSKKRFSMIDWSEEEVKAFLVFAFYGGTEPAIKDASINMTLLEMGIKYQITAMVGEMKKWLLTRPTHLYTTFVATRMHDIAQKTNDSKLISKAIEALKM